MEKAVFSIYHTHVHGFDLQASKRPINGRNPDFLNLAVFSLSIDCQNSHKWQFGKTDSNAELLSECTQYIYYYGSTEGHEYPDL